MTLDWLADALRAEGCTVVEEGNWRARGRPGTFDPYGVLWHHTGTTTSMSNPFPTKNTLIDGRPDLAGPLCQVGIGYDGVCHVIAAGRANHAGACNGFGPFTSAEDGNAQLVGFEIDYDGTQAMSAAQQDAATRCSTAILKRFKKDQGYAANHKETSTTGKWDTGGMSGDQLRALIKARLDGGGQDPDMPNYVHGRATKAVNLKAGWNNSIQWDDVIKGSNVLKGSSVHIPDRPYTATVLATLDISGTSDTIRTQTIEVDADNNIAESNAQVEHPVTSGSTYVQDTRHGWCNSGRVLRVRLYVPVAAKMTSADLTLLYW